MWQAIAWANVHQDVSRHMASLGHNELMSIHISFLTEEGAHGYVVIYLVFLNCQFLTDAYVFIIVMCILLGIGISIEVSELVCFLDDIEVR